MAPPICQVEEQTNKTNIGTKNNTQQAPRKVPTIPPRTRAITILKKC